MQGVAGGEDLASRGRRLLGQGDYGGALGLFERALLLEPKDPDLWNGKGAALRSLGRYAESVRCFERSLELDPRDRHSS